MCFSEHGPLCLLSFYQKKSIAPLVYSFILAWHNSWFSLSSNRLFGYQVVTSPSKLWFSFCWLHVKYGVFCSVFFFICLPKPIFAVSHSFEVSSALHSNCLVASLVQEDDSEIVDKPWSSENLKLFRLWSLGSTGGFWGVICGKILGSIEYIKTGFYCVAL